MDMDAEQVKRVTETKKLPFILQLHCIVEENESGELVTTHVVKGEVLVHKAVDTHTALRIKRKTAQLSRLVMETALGNQALKEQLIGEQADSGLLLVPSKG